MQGLDLRRHSVLGVAAEEYSDSRIPSPAIRGSWRFDNGWELEGYAQQFRPSILPRPGTPYSLVAEAFTVYEEPGYEQDEDDIDVGFRILVSGMTSTCHSWPFQEQTMALSLGSKWSRQDASVLIAVSHLLPDPLGTASADEWFWGASWLRFNPVTTLDTSTTDAPLQQLQRQGHSRQQACGCRTVQLRSYSAMPSKGELDLFFSTALVWSLRGYLHRDYDEEVIVGASMKYVFTGAPDSFLTS